MSKNENSSNNEFFPAINKYKMEEVKIEDKGLERYMNLESKDYFLGAPNANKSFGKSKTSIVERLINNMMRTEVYSGKKAKAYKSVRGAFEIIEKRTKANPIQAFVDALQFPPNKSHLNQL